MGNHIPFLVLKSGNISRKFVTKKMRSCDKNFGQLQLYHNFSYIKSVFDFREVLSKQLSFLLSVSEEDV